MNSTIPVTMEVIQTELQFDMEVQDNRPVDMEMAAPVITYPQYGGVLTVTPSKDTQVLNTSGKMVNDDIIVNPIPSNYGKVTWNGAYLTVS